MTRTILPARAAAALLLAALAACAGGGSDDAAAPAAGDTRPNTAIGWSKGSPDAPVVVMEFSDFGCPYCARFSQETYPALHREFVETGRVRWQYVPFVMGMFPNGAEAARAAECAGEQDRFWPMHDLLYAEQRRWKETPPAGAAALMADLAARLDLDRDRFASCYAEDRQGARTRAANELAAQFNVQATPTFFIDGRMVQGAIPLDVFRQALIEFGAGEPAR